MALHPNERFRKGISMKRNMMSSGLAVLGLTICSVLLIPTGSSLAQQPERSSCSIIISDPEKGTIVHGQGTVSGTANIPPDSHLWILAHKSTLNSWWPQGGGETPIRDGKWAVDVTYGIESDTGDFEVAAVAVGENAHNDLKKWVADNRTGRYLPMQFPSTVAGCPIARVTVVKR
ncbi:MAG: hypothetical protein ABSH28_01465 [Acidobacteriota bacterium]